MTENFEKLKTDVGQSNARLEEQIERLAINIETTQKQLAEVLRLVLQNTTVLALLCSISFLLPYFYLFFLTYLVLTLGQTETAGPVRPANADRASSKPPPSADLICKGTFSGHDGTVWALALAVDIDCLISASSDQSIKVWDLTTFKCKFTLEGHEGIVHVLGLFRELLFSGGSDRTVRVWDIAAAKCIRTIEQHDNTVCSLVVVPPYLITGSYHKIRVFDLQSYDLVQVLTGHTNWVRALCHSGPVLYSGSGSELKIWNLHSLECEKSFNLEHDIYSLAVAGQRLICGTYENAVLIFNLQSTQVTHTLNGHIGCIYSVAVGSGRFYTGSYDSTIKVWSLDTLLCQQTLLRHTGTVEALVAYGTALFSGSADQSIKIWS